MNSDQMNLLSSQSTMFLDCVREFFFMYSGHRHRLYYLQEFDEFRRYISLINSGKRARI